MKGIYKLEMWVAAIGLALLGIYLYAPYVNITGHVSGVNLTVYTQTLDLLIDSSKSYNFIAEKSLNLRSFLLSGQILGAGRVEILLDDGNGNQYLVYENIVKKPSNQNLITGQVIDSSGGEGISNENNANLVENNGLWFVINQKSKILKYEFKPLQDDEMLTSGFFYFSGEETQVLPEGYFSQNYELIFRMDEGTTVKLDQVTYTLYENQS